MPYTYRYPRPALTADCVVFGVGPPPLQVLLIERRGQPFAGTWALPGGFVDIDEPLEAAARRELKEETGLVVGWLSQLQTFGQVDRDPRGRVVSVAHWTVVRTDQHPVRPASDARRAGWFAADRPPKLAFDHRQILKVALDRLRQHVQQQPIGLGLLPARFTTGQLQQLYQVLLGRSVDGQKLRRALLRHSLLVPVGATAAKAGGRRQHLYRFDKRCYRRLEKTGFCLKL